MSDLPAAKKSLGQHWLTDATSLAAICSAAALNDEDTVVEIGPGTGTLTRLLVQKTKQVIAVEFDRLLAEQLPKRVHATNLQVVQKDILQFDFGSVPPDYKVVANIPYYLTSNLIRVLSETHNQAKQIVLLIQKEVAERVAADPGDMSLLAVSAQFYWDVSLDIVVPAHLFTPAPKVNSQVLVLKRRDQKLFEVDEMAFFRVVKAGFAARRKTLLNSLAGGLRADKDKIQHVLAAAKLSPNIRPQNLSLHDWHKLYQACHQEKLI